MSVNIGDYRQRVAVHERDHSSKSETDQREAIANVAHDLRTPLAAMHTALDLLDDFSTMSHEEICDLLRRFRRGVSWMNGLIDNLATWTAIGDGRISIRRSAATVQECIESAAEMVNPILARRGQEICISCPEQAPTVYVDTLRLGQVLVNLLTNASAYSDYGDVISITASVTFSEIRVTVTDNGPGMSRDEQERVFGRYNRGMKGGEILPGGQGLGLHIVKTLVELHDGRVGLDSTPGQGSSFWFTLPYPTVARTKTAA